MDAMRTREQEAMTMEELMEREIADQEQDEEIDAIWESILQAQGI